MFGIELSMIWAVLIARRRVLSMWRSTALTLASASCSRWRRTLTSATRCRRPSHRCGMATRPGWCWAAADLFAAFPKAYAALMPALYLPIYLMLLALIFRGVAFEFRHHGRERGKKWWTVAFSGGSIVAAVAQGFVLGGFIQGVNVVDGQFVGGPLDWLDAVLRAGRDFPGGGLCAPRRRLDGVQNQGGAVRTGKGLGENAGVAGGARHGRGELGDPGG